MENTTDHLTGTSTLLRPDVAADHILDSASAPVTIIEYGDFESPSCGRAHVGLKILLGHFGDRVRFVFRHYPEIEIHPHAERAAEAGEAAGAQGRFWPYYDVLFEHREYLSERHLRQYAAQVGVDLERYDNEMNDHLYRQRVQQHAMDGRNLGIRAMPTFFIDGILTDVSFGLRHLEDAVDHELRMIDSTRHRLLRTSVLQYSCTPMSRKPHGKSLDSPMPMQLARLQNHWAPRCPDQGRRLAFA